MFDDDRETTRRGGASAPRAPLRVRARAAFSLIEVMVATAILMVVVLMIGQLFTQASRSWDSGYARAEGGMVVRSVAGTLARDLETAVDMRDFVGGKDPIKISEGSSGSIEFVRLARSEDGFEKEYRHVKYSFSGGSRCTREETALKRNSNGRWQDDGSTVRTLLSGKDGEEYNGRGYESSFTVSAIRADLGRVDNDRPYNAEDVGEATWSDASSAPVGVKLRFELKPTGSFSGLSVVSYGRDGTENRLSKTKDDIISF